jgi:chromate transporter
VSQNSASENREPTEADTIGGRLKELALLFLKLGTVAFGGPAAHVAMMEDEVVLRRRWLSHEDFLDLFAATNLIPGPNSTEMAIHIGHKRAGWPGLLVAGICFILPAACIVLALAWVYVRFGKLPEAAGILYGVKPVVIAVVLQALWGLGRTAVKTKFLAVTGIVVVAASFLGINELLLLFIAGAAVCIERCGVARFTSSKTTPALFLGVTSAFNGASAASGAAAFGLWPLFLFFLKVGAVLFGSGYVLLAFLRADLVERWHWLTEAQLLDAVAIGRSRPGRSSRRQPLSATCWPGRRAECSQRLAFFCPRSFSWQSAVHSCRGCDARRSSAHFLTES